MKHLILNLTKILLLTIMLTALKACDKHQDDFPGPTTQTFSEPGIIRFEIKQHSHGADEDFQTDQLYLVMKNQGQQPIEKLEFAIRGYSALPQNLGNLIYWEEGTFEKRIEIHKTDSIILHPDFHELIPDERLEIDLISCQLSDRELISDYSGSFQGDFVIIKDSLFNSPMIGRHMCWIDFKGNISIIFDRDELPWCSYKGSLHPSGQMYGKMTTSDSFLDLEGRISKQLNGNGNKLHFDFEYETDTIHNYHFSLNLTKN